MVKKIGDKKINKVGGTNLTDKVQDTEAVGSVGAVKPTGSVAGTGRVGAVQKRRPTREISIEEREELFKLVNEEADKMFSGGAIPASKKQLIKEAVKMAIDSGILEKEDPKSPK